MKLEGYCHHQSCSIFGMSACPFKSTMGLLEISILAFSAVFQSIGIPIGESMQEIMKHSIVDVNPQWIYRWREHGATWTMTVPV